MNEPCVYCDERIDEAGTDDLCATCQDLMERHRELGALIDARACIATDRAIMLEAALRTGRIPYWIVEGGES